MSVPNLPVPAFKVTAQVLQHLKYQPKDQVLCGLQLFSVSRRLGQQVRIRRRFYEPSAVETERFNSQPCASSPRPK